MKSTIKKVDRALALIEAGQSIREACRVARLSPSVYNYHVNKKKRKKKNEHLTVNLEPSYQSELVTLRHLIAAANEIMRSVGGSHGNA